MLHSPKQASYRANGPEMKDCPTCEGGQADDCPECDGSGRVRPEIDVSDAIP